MIFEGLEGKYDPKFTADPCPTAGDFQDFLGHLKNQIEEQTDGRPRPIQIETGSDFARCDNPGWDELATIGDYPLSAKELRELTKWIESVLAWHSTQPKRKRKTQLETRSLESEKQ
jgi:hypothetical protein